MSFVYYGGVRELFRLAHAANPTLPVNLSETNCFIPKIVATDEDAVATFAGRYGMGVKGYVDASYRRLDLAKLFAGYRPKVGILAPESLFELLGDIYEATGFAFDPVDLEPVVPVEGQSLPWVVRLKAANTSPIYFGEAEVEFVLRKERLFEVVSERDVDLTLAGVPSTDERQRAEFITFGVDYSMRAPELLAITPGTMEWTVAEGEAHERCIALEYALNTVDRLPWKTATGPLAWTLNGARVVYNGPVRGYDPIWYNSSDIRTPNSRFDRVLVVSFEQDVTGPTGFYGSVMFIHYNTEIDNEVPDGNS